MNNRILLAGLALCTGTALAALPPPSDEAKAKAAEAAARAAHGGKVEAYKLCLSMDKVAQAYYAKAKSSGAATNPPAATPACADPGPFVYTPAGAAAPATAPATPAPAAATAAVPKMAPKP